MLYFINPGKGSTRKAAKRRPTARAIPVTLRRTLRRKAQAKGQRWFGVNVNPATAPKKTTRRRLTAARRGGTLPRSSITHRSAQVVPVRPSDRHTRDATMSGRRRRKSSIKRNPAPKRRRRRRVAVARRAANPVRRVTRRRRRRVNPFAAHRRHAARPHRTHRRRRHRNPSMTSVKGLVATITQGLKDGALVVGGEVATRKLRGALTGLVPAAQQSKVASGPGYIALTLASALAVTVAARKFAPKFARTLAAGAFAETINCALAQTPVAPYLSALPQRNRVRVAPVGVRAYPRPALIAPVQAAAGVRAYPRSVGMPVMAG